ncbi:tubulin-tyrosine ligase family-domain-containing protein [Gongronella butleri]|nr:tubulin-tyrosine ligase family-domain-containing protein [Gongronella butleri]
MSSAFESFVAVHQYQLASIPEDLWQPLFMKLGEDYLDAGSVMELHQGDPVDGYSLHIKQGASLEKYSDIFLVDHAWTTSAEMAKKELRENPALLDRVENLINVEKEEWVDDNDSDSDVEHDDEVIRMVAEQANVSYDKAKAALEEENYEVLNAITNLTLDPEFKKQSDALQEQVMGQLIASGKAQEKEEKVNKEKEELKQKRLAEWMTRRIDTVYEHMWSYVQSYSYAVLQTDGQSATKTALYINDEVGSALCHSSTPNMACVPFIFSRGATGMIPYSVMFPLESIKEGELVTCDMVPKALTDDLQRTAYRFALEQRINPSGADAVTDADRTKLMDAYRSHAVAPKAAHGQVLATKAAYIDYVSSKNKSDGSVSVFTDVDALRSSVTLAQIKWVDDASKANIAWTRKAADSDNKLGLSNHLANDACLTSLDGLAKLVRATYGDAAWFPTTYDLRSALGAYVGDVLQQNEQAGAWIVKPSDASGHGRIASGIAEVVRQIDLPSPVVAQHYVPQPCLYNGKKFTLQFVAVLRQYQPGAPALAALYRRFWVRLANKKYLKDQADDDRDAHLLDSPIGAYQMTQLDHASFTRNMEKEHSIQWPDVQASIQQVIQDVLGAASSQAQPLGLGDKEENTDAFGVYMFDLTLTASFQPVLFRVHDAADGAWLCKHDKDLPNRVLSVVDGRFGGVEKALDEFVVLGSN